MRLSLVRGWSSLLVIGLMAATACGSDGTGSDGAITLALDLTSATVEQGGTLAVTGTLTRSGGFTGDVAISAEGVPAGVTATVDHVVIASGTSTATVVIAVGAATPIGLSNITVRGKAPGLTDATTSFALTVTFTPNYALQVTPTALSAVQGGTTATALVVVGRTNFTGAVTLSVGHLTEGVTAAFDPPAPTGNNAALTLTVGSAAVPGVYDLTVDGVSTAGNRSVPLQLTVMPVSDFTLNTTPAGSATVAQSGNTNVTVNVNRTGGFSDRVSLSATGQPGGLMVEFAPNPAAANSSVMTLTATGALAAGTYPIVIHGNTSSTERVTNLAVTVTAPSGGGNAVVSFAGCGVDTRAIWLAYQDGNSAWARVAGVADVYQFNITQAKGGLAYVTQEGDGTTHVVVLYLSQAEMTGGTVNNCITASGKTVNGTLANLGAGRQAMVSFGGSASGRVADGPFELTNVRDGSNDLVAYVRGVADVSSTDRILFSRGRNPANGGSLGTVDVSSAVVVGSAVMTLSGVTDGETVSQSMAYYTGAACTAAYLYSTVVAAPPTFAAYGAPAGQPATDMHGLTAQAVAGAATTIRSVTESFHVMAARSIALPSLLPIPAVSKGGGPYMRPMVVTTLPADLNGAAVFSYSEPLTGRDGELSATAGWLGGLSVSLALPDFSALAGWNNSWVSATAAALDWTFTVTGGTEASRCQEGGRTVLSARSGTL